MRRLRRFGLAVGCFLLATCCPTVWFTVTHNRGGPVPYLPVPQPDDDPIPRAGAYDNRFDVLANCCKPPIEAARYEDVGNNSVTYTRSLAALHAIWQRYGNPHATVPPIMLHGKLQCFGKRCRAIEVSEQVPKLEEARSLAVLLDGNYLDVPIEKCEPLQQTGGGSDCGQPGACGDQVGLCRNYSSGTRIALTQELICAGCNGHEVEFATMAQALSTTALTFVHLSDVQMRDGDVTLDDRELSKKLDWLIESFEYDPDQMVFGRYMIEGLFATINAAVDKFADDVQNLDRPAFIIHTGDLIDSGAVSEAQRVHTLVDGLKIPFFDVIGNHDVLVFGNMLPPKKTGSGSDAGCVRAGSVLAPYASWFQRHEKPWFLPTMLCTEKTDRVELIAADTHAESLANFIKQFEDPPEVPSVELAPDKYALKCPNDAFVAAEPLTRNHGFDLNKNAGYYAFVKSLTLYGKSRHAFFIALDSMDLKEREGGNIGRIRTPQFEWLKKTLACVGPDDLVFLFAHHGLSDITIGDAVPAKDRNVPSELENLLVAHNKKHHNIVAFMYGHHHEHAICKDGHGRPRPTVCTSFYEVETASIVDFPQEGRLVRIKDAEHGVAFLELTTFGTRLKDGDEFSQAVGRARRGAQRDYCNGHTSSHPRCSDDMKPFRDDGDETNARLFFQLPEVAK